MASKKPRKKSYEPVTQFKGRIPKKRWEEIMEDATQLVEDGQYSQYNSVALGNRWRVSRPTVKKIHEILFADSQDNLMLRRAKWMGMYERLERNLANILHRAETIRMCVNNKCYYEGTEETCPLCGHPARFDLNVQVAMCEKIPDLMDRATNFLERFNLKEKPADNINIKGQIEHGFVINYVMPEKMIEGKQE